VLEQLELAGRELQRALSAVDLAAIGVEAKVANDHEGAAARRAPPQQRADPGEQLVALERLDEVVVGACIEALHARVESVAGGEHQDRHVALGSHPAGHLHAVELRQPEVEHHRVRLEHVRLVESLLAVAGHAYLVALLVEGTTEHAGDVGVVLDHEHTRASAHGFHGREGAAIGRRMQDSCPALTPSISAAFGGD
jgi:hypothetical protein